MIKKLSAIIDNHSRPKLILGVFLLLWFCLNIIQAVFTELAHDEAYYWMYSRYLDWGYFDHPPMIAILVKAGYFFFKSELGVRLFLTIMGTGTIYLIYLILKEHITRLSYFIGIVLLVGIVKTHIGGFLAIPDIPLVFFSAAFYLVYKHYLRRDSIWYAALLGLIVAAMFYSKYHAILVVGFTLMSNFKILSRRTFWIIPIIVLILLIPHISWHFEHNFPAIKYHLVSRSKSYKIKYTLNYLLGQALIAGPVAGVFLYYFALKHSVNGDLFKRAMKFNLIGFIVFFFFMSFKGRVEAHWTAVAMIPLIYLAYCGVINNNNALKWIRIQLLISIPLFLLARVSLVYPLIPPNLKLGREFHNWDVWAQQIKERAGEQKVVFSNSFQRPSKYSFYSGGEFAHSLNNIYGRKSQYDIWNFEDSIQGENVIMFNSSWPTETIPGAACGETLLIREYESFKSFNNIDIKCGTHEILCDTNEMLKLPISIMNNSSDTLIIGEQGSEQALQLSITCYKRKWYKQQLIQDVEFILQPEATTETVISFKAPTIKGEFKAYIGVIGNYLMPSHNSDNLTINVE